VSAASGDVQLVVVASLVPLEEADPTLAAMLDVIHDTGARSSDGVPVPAVATSGPQPEAKLLSLGAGDLAADFDAHGVAVLTVTLETAP
jgi:hypothetical protein